MLANHPTAPTTTLANYTAYLRSIVEANRERAATFEADSCGAFIQDNAPILFAASFDEIRQLITGTGRFSEPPNRSEDDLHNAIFQALPPSADNPMYVQLIGHRIPDIELHCPGLDLTRFNVTASFHGGNSNGGNRSLELLDSMTSLLESALRSKIDCMVPHCHINNRRHRMV